MGNDQSNQHDQREEEWRKREDELEKEKEDWNKWLEEQRREKEAELQKEQIRRSEQARSLEKEERKRNEIKKLRNELKHLKPGDSVKFPDGNTKYPLKFNVGLFGATGIGKSSLLNSLEYAFTGELTELTREQTSPEGFHGGNTVRQLPVQITQHLRFIDNRGVAAEDLERIEAGNEIIRQLEGRSSYAEIVDWRQPDSRGATRVEDRRIYCTVLVFNAQNPQSVYTILKKLVDQLFKWQGRYPIGVITHVDVATPEQLEDMYVVLNSAGLTDTYEVANITNKRHELDPDHQLNLLKLMKRCIKDGDRIFSLREEIVRREVEERIEEERKAEEARLKQARKEMEIEEARRAQEAEAARIAREKQEEMQKKIDEEVNFKLREKADEERRARDKRKSNILFFLAFLLPCIIIFYYEILK